MHFCQHESTVCCILKPFLIWSNQWSAIVEKLICASTVLSPGNDVEYGLNLRHYTGISNHLAYRFILWGLITQYIVLEREMLLNVHCHRGYPLKHVGFLPKVRSLRLWRIFWLVSNLQPHVHCILLNVAWRNGALSIFEGNTKNQAYCGM
jgi:hypothetical protein